MNFLTGFRRHRGAIMLSATLLAGVPALAQAPARQLGTVKSVSGDTLVIATDKGASLNVQVDSAAKIVLLAPGSTDLKTAAPSSFDNIAVGDRVLASGTTAEAPVAIHATRVVVMKSGDIAQRNEQLQADWQKRGSGGIVSAVDAATGDITIKSGARTVTLKTTPKTVFRRYSSGSVKYQDAKNSTLSEISAGDQLRVRGDRAADGTSITADEIVSGSFSNVAGTIVSIDTNGQSLVVKDLAKKKNVTVHLSPATNIRTLPPEMATRLAARAHAAARGGAVAANGAAARPAGEGSAAAGEGMHRGPGAGGPAGARSRDLAQIIASLPTQTPADLKTGEALMIVGSQSAPTEPLTAITILSGVEPILSAPGSNAMTLSPWNLDSNAGGTGGPDMGGSGGSQQ